ncbi:nuclear transport factor 2 family protein [Temperatibacter marinus]|uniref:Nuclear transport factor 2 family protein n=1 Tax=Temperatibacter marinus TaxID=1456591 RepID=A0AA52EH13_9PROT|nr:nuclear transport factor 2 family protein [Temperatibacter marinus]WND02174.1 nuclear transport factor 2 family protein [Temperatibacter marinus]
MKITPLFLSLGLMSLLGMPLTADDKADVQAAIKGYVHGFYLGDASLLEKHVHTSMRKIGWYRGAGDKAYKGPYSMTQKSAMEFAPGWGSKFDPGKDGHMVITIFEIMDKVASAKVEAHWGVDFFHLAKSEEGQWQIYNIIWQSHSDGKLK